MKKTLIILMVSLLAFSLITVVNCSNPEPEEPATISGFNGVVTASGEAAEQMASLRQAQANAVASAIKTLVGDAVWQENETALTSLFLGEADSGWQETNAYIEEERMSNTTEIEGGFSATRTIVVDVAKLEAALQEAGFTIMAP